MPLGKRHIESGILQPGKWGYTLCMIGGGKWELDASRRYNHLIGHRVTVEGTRGGFNLLNVDRIWRIGETPPPPRHPIMKLLRGVALIID